MGYASKSDDRQATDPQRIYLGLNIQHSINVFEILGN